MEKDNKTLTIEINNLTEAQAIAIEDMMSTWVSLGNMGSSRWTKFYADGDGNFRPKITVNGRKAKHFDMLKDDEYRELFWNKQREYEMDFDEIDIILDNIKQDPTWTLAKSKEAAKRMEEERKKNNELKKMTKLAPQDPLDYNPDFVSQLSDYIEERRMTGH